MAYNYHCHTCSLSLNDFSSDGSEWGGNLNSHTSIDTFSFLYLCVSELGSWGVIVCCGTLKSRVQCSPDPLESEIIHYTFPPGISAQPSQGSYNGWSGPFPGYREDQSRLQYMCSKPICLQAQHSILL